MANRLAQETSPYLLEHAQNPVDWYPWGPEALARARQENKPILLSIGYSACHWCHVMARESFEDEETAALMNRDFIPIKVDREERPDLDEAYARLAREYDPAHGGFGAAPKFPQPMLLEFLLRSHVRTGEPAALEMATDTLRAMAAGGMYDQLGGGFHRYSVDARWLVPHFEKMLYDQATLVRAYLHAWLVAQQERHRRVVEEAIDYVLRDLRHPDGGFYSAEDADSE